MDQGLPRQQPKRTNKPASKLMACCLLALAFIVPRLGWSSETVKVGMIVFPPFIEQQSEGAPLSGLAVDLIKAMNAFQTDYHFVSVLSSGPRKQHDFDNGIYDMMLFDNINWGWQDHPVDASQLLLKGDGEVFIALTDSKRDQSYFDQLTGKRLVGLRGYHYKFANFNADPQFLEQQFNMMLAFDHASSLNMILRQRGDIAILTKSYLLRHLEQNPELKPMLLVSDKMDQAYQHSIILRQGIRPSIEEINQILDGMRRQSLLTQLWQQYGLMEIEQ